MKLLVALVLSLLLVLACILPVMADDTSAPTIGEIIANTNVAGFNATLSCLIADSSGVGFAIPSWNNTGAWLNETAIDLEDEMETTANFTGTWNNTLGNTVSVKFYSNDTVGNMGASDLYNFTLTQAEYVVTITKDKSTVFAGDVVSFVVHPLRDNITVSDVVCNVTVDGALYKQNVTDRSFTYSESVPQAHTFNVTELYDSELNYSVTFDVSSLTVDWGLAGGGGGLGGVAGNDTAVGEEALNNTEPTSPLQPFSFTQLPVVDTSSIAVVIVIVCVSVFLLTVAHADRHKRTKIKERKPRQGSKIPKRRPKV
jgi:hypothetical protein